MQTAGNFVRRFVEFAARMKFGQDDFRGRDFLRLDDIDGNAAAVVDNSDAIVDMDGDVDLVAMAGQGFIDGVVDDFINQMVQTRARWYRRCTSPGRLRTASRPF